MLTAEEVWAYCENESTYGYPCRTNGCPHCGGIMSYCSSLTDNQVQNVLCDEAKRATNNDCPAEALYYEAREECVRRGIEPDDVLAERDLVAP